MFNRLNAYADLSHEQELRGRVVNSFNNVKIFGNVSGGHCFKAADRDCGLSFSETTSHRDFRRVSSSSTMAAAAELVVRYLVHTRVT